MIYSVWRPDSGGYDYYETPERVGLSDDLPIPRLTAQHAIGVPSTDIGRPFSNGKKLGSGPLARGAVAPMGKAGLSGLPDLSTGMGWVVILGAGMVLGFGICVMWRAR